MRFIVFLFFLISLQLQAAELQLPSLSSPVMDLAGFLSEAERKDLADLAYEINTHNGPQITILTVNDLQGYPVEEYSIRVAEKWQLGTKDKDNGLLLVLAKQERVVRIEVGNGIEGEITDYDSSRYTKEIFPPYFRRGEFHAAFRLYMEDVADKFNIKLEGGHKVVRRAPRVVKTKMGEFFIIAIIAVIAIGSLIFKNRPAARGVFTGSGLSIVSLIMGLPLAILVIVFFVGLVLGLVGIGNFITALLMSGGGSGRGGGYGGGSGGSWSGGGGGFSGGGSSGSW